jgi:hypothetical protein
MALTTTDPSLPQCADEQASQTIFGRRPPGTTRARLGRHRARARLPSGASASDHRHMDEPPDKSTWLMPVTHVEPSARAAIYVDFREFVVLSGGRRLEELVGQRMPTRVAPSGIGRVGAPEGAGVEFCRVDAWHPHEASRGVLRLKRRDLRREQDVIAVAEVDRAVAVVDGSHRTVKAVRAGIGPARPGRPREMPGPDPGAGCGAAGRRPYGDLRRPRRHRWMPIPSGRDRPRRPACPVRPRAASQPLAT